MFKIWKDKRDDKRFYTPVRGRNWMDMITQTRTHAQRPWHWHWKHNTHDSTITDQNLQLPNSEIQNLQPNKPKRHDDGEDPNHLNYEIHKHLNWILVCCYFQNSRHRKIPRANIQVLSLNSVWQAALSFVCD